MLITEWKDPDWRKGIWVSSACYSFGWLDITLLLLITTSRNFLGWEVPSHSDDKPILREGCVVCNGCGQRAVSLSTVGKEHFIYNKNCCISSIVCLFYKEEMINSLSSVVRTKDSGVLSGRGGVRFSSAAQPKIINSNLILDFCTPTLEMKCLDSQG